MYGDLLLDRLGGKLLGPAPLDLELLHTLSTFHWNAEGRTLGWWFCLLRVGLSSSISAKVSKMSCQEYKGYKWQCPTT